MKRLLILLALFAATAQAQDAYGLVNMGYHESKRNSDTTAMRLYAEQILAAARAVDTPRAIVRESAISGGSLPAGMIVMWGGAIANIPSGWQLCDGTNGTPDLRNIFIKGVAAGNEPGGIGGDSMHTPVGTIGMNAFTDVINHTHAVNVTDGGHNHTQNSHNHTQDSHNHTQDAHAHGMAEGTTDGSGTFMDRSNAAAATTATTDNATATNQAATATNQAATATNQSATTGITATTSNPAGGVSSITPTGTFTGTSGNTEPRYYKLAYIQKL
jgi:hypothetical protein